MPPKTRGNKIYKGSKENIGNNCKTQTKTINKVSKPRKALADKTNSTSDDNTSLLRLKPSKNILNEPNLIIKERPRRERRLPKRYVEIKNQFIDKNDSLEKGANSIPALSKHVPIVVLSPLKAPKTALDNTLNTQRPKRISRLPSRFDDHSISPSKFIPLQPAYASTPKDLNKEVKKKDSNKTVKPKKGSASDKEVSPKVNTKRNVNKKIEYTSKTNSPNSSADTNNNAKTDHLPQTKTKTKQASKISPPPPLKATSSKKTVNKNVSIRILEDRKKSLKRDASNFDVYEFTYDPTEEPPPQKKKRKKPAKKREPKPKRVFFKDNYDKNLAKALTNLKNTISEKSVKNIKQSEYKKLTTEIVTAHPATDMVVTTLKAQPVSSIVPNIDHSHTSVRNYNSVRVEDIALDFEEDSFIEDVNYSPVRLLCQPIHQPTNSLCQPTPTVQSNHRDSDRDVPNNIQNNSPVHQNNISSNTKRVNTLNIPKHVSNDPLNLIEGLSFFDNQPVASSSMNVSSRNPAASPWRVEFGCLPIKWQVNTYVKPNMTPAFDSSFMNFNEGNKKHVYTNLVTDTNENTDVPHIYEDYASKLKQTSIISFIKEVVENKEKKKREKMTPLKTTSLFEDVNNIPNNGAGLATNSHVTPKKNAQTNLESHDQSTPSSVSNISNENEVSNNSKDNDKSKESATSSSRKKRNKNATYFGFDDSENVDQENISPVKNVQKRKLRSLKTCLKAVLQENNEQKGPTRAVLTIAVKSKTIQRAEIANNLFDQLKSATEAPVFPDKEPVQSTQDTNITEVQNNVDANDDQSVHLFEDLELIHHLKAHRKSYGKAKKAVTFHQNSISDSDGPSNDGAEQCASSDDDDSLDLTFKFPTKEPKKASRKKKPKKKKVTKKQEKELEVWAAGFNSMCEDIEEFDLVVE